MQKYGPTYYIPKSLEILNSKETGDHLLVLYRYDKGDSNFQIPMLELALVEPDKISSISSCDISHDLITNVNNDVTSINGIYYHNPVNNETLNAVYGLVLDNKVNGIELKYERKQFISFRF